LNENLYELKQCKTYVVITHWSFFHSTLYLATWRVWLTSHNRGHLHIEIAAKTSERGTYIMYEMFMHFGGRSKEEGCVYLGWLIRKQKWTPDAHGRAQHMTWADSGSVSESRLYLECAYHTTDLDGLHLNWLSGFLTSCLMSSDVHLAWLIISCDREILSDSSGAHDRRPLPPQKDRAERRD